MAGCRASASITIGTDDVATTSRTSASVSASRPSPGPSTRASIRSSLVFNKCCPSNASPPVGVSGQPTHITSGARAANAAANDSGTNAVTSPAPLRNAASAAIRTAPG